MHYITTEMDEIEREEFFRIKRTQQKKMIRAQKAAEAKKLKELLLRGDPIPPVETVDEILDEVDKIAERDEVQDKAEIKEVPPPTAAGEQYKYIVESPKESKENLTKPLAYLDHDSNKHCGVCCSETLEELKRKIEVLMNRINEKTPFDDVIDESIPREIYCTEAPEKPKHVDSFTQVSTDFTEGLYSGGPKLKTEEIVSTEILKKGTPVAKTEKTPVSSQKQSSTDDLSSLPSITKMSKSESPLSGSSLGYIKKVFKETVKIRRLPNRSGQICEEKEVITVKSEIKKYKPPEVKHKTSKDFNIDDLSNISGENPEAGPSNMTKYCRLCEEEDVNDKNDMSDCQDECTSKCKEKNVQYSDENDTPQMNCNVESVNHITLPRQSPILERKSDINSLPIVEEYDIDNTLKELGLPLWNNWTENISMKVQSDTNTCISEAISKDEDTQNLCNISTLINDTDSKHESDNILNKTIVLSDVIHNTESTETNNHLNNNKDVDKEIPNTSNESITEITYTEYYDNNDNIQEVHNKIITELSNTEFNVEPQHITKKIEFKDFLAYDNEQETPTTCNIFNLNENETILIEPSYVKGKVEFSNTIDIKRSFDEQLQIILTNNIVSDSAIIIDGRNNSCIPYTAAQTKDLKNAEQTTAVLNPVGSEMSSPQDKISNDSRSVTDSPKECSEQCLACGYRQYQSSQGTDILSLVCTPSILNVPKTKSECCNTELRDVKKQSTPHEGSLHKNSFTNCRSVVNNFKGYLAKMWQQTKTVGRNNVKDCIYYQIYDSKNENEEKSIKENTIEKEISVVDVKVNCPMCEKDDRENSNGIIKKLFDNIQQSLKKSFVTKNSYSQTSQTNFELPSRSSFFLRRPSSSSNRLAECNAKILMKYMFDDDNEDREQFNNNYESQKYYACPLKSTKEITPHYCPLCAAAANNDNTALISSIPAETNDLNHTEIQIIEFDTKAQCPDCLKERNAKYANEYSEEDIQPPRFTNPHLKVYHQYMVHVDNSVPMCLAAKCTANCKISRCSNFLDDVDSRLINIIDILPSVRTNADILKQAVLSGIIDAEKKVEIYSNTIRGVKNKLDEIELQIADADKTDIETSSRQYTYTPTTDRNKVPECLSKDSRYESESDCKQHGFKNVVDSLTSFMWKTRLKNEFCHIFGNEPVCYACNRPLNMKTNDYKVVQDTYAQTNITLSCPLQGKCMSKCKSTNSSERFAKYNSDNSKIQYELKSKCCKPINIPKISFANDDRKQNATKQIDKGSCNLCFEEEGYKVQNSVQKDYIIDNSFKDYNKEKFEEKFNKHIFKEKAAQTCSNVPVDILLEKSKSMEPAIIKAIKKVVKCGNKQCINKLTSVFESENNLSSK